MTTDKPMTSDELLASILSEQREELERGRQRLVAAGETPARVAYLLAFAASMQASQYAAIKRSIDHFHLLASGGGPEVH